MYSALDIMESIVPYMLLCEHRGWVLKGIERIILASGSQRRAILPSKGIWQYLGVHLLIT